MGTRAKPGTRNGQRIWKRLQQFSPGRAILGILLLGLMLWNIWILVAVPRVGVADNGDFWRVGRPAGIHPLEDHDRQGRWISPVYRVGPHNILSMPSTPAGVVLLSRSIGAFSVNPGEYDLRQAGLAYLSIMSLIILLAALTKLRTSELLVATFVVSDSSYLLFFNSLYADGSLILSLFALALWLIRFGSPGALDDLQSPAKLLGSGALLISILAFGTFSKMQYSMLAAVALPLLLVLSYRSPLARWGVACIALLALMGPSHFLFGSGANFDWANKYHATYSGLARLASNPEDALASVGIPDAFRSLPRRDVFASGITPEHPVHQHLANVSRIDLVAAYLADPPAIGRAIQVISTELAHTRSHRRGTRERAMTPPGRRPYTSWSPSFGALRKRIFSASEHTFILILLGSGCWALWAYLRGRWDGFHTLQIFLLTWICSQLVVIVLGDGLVILRQHLIGARLGVDLLLGFTLLQVVRWLAVRLKSWRKVLH